MIEIKIHRNARLQNGSICYDKEESYTAEKVWVYELNVKNEEGYNVTVGVITLGNILEGNNIVVNYNDTVLIK